jgi:proteasome lid subunit RPN8/RPN11
MSETLTYAALITISLPGQAQSATAIVRLAPADAVTTAGRTKLLRDCTLADLEAFAAELEAGVWETYDAITLLELTEEAQATIEVLAAESETPVADWGAQAIVLPDGPPATLPDPVAEAIIVTPPVEEETPPPTAETLSTPDEPVAALEPGTEAEEAVVETTPETPETPALVETPPPALPSAVETAVPETVVAPPSETVIAPSQARVRVAGQQLPAGHATWAAVDILIDEPALRQTQAHALSSLDREVAGVLVGPRPEKQPDGRYVVHIIDAIIARHTVMQGASVTYTPESWRYMNDTLAERYPDETAVMVGWYHTHPGFGIFLSGMDLFIHQNFFTQLWHVAYVLDPRARASGFFCWDRYKSRVGRYDFMWPHWAHNSW